MGQRGHQNIGRRDSLRYDGVEHAWSGFVGTEETTAPGERIIANDGAVLDNSCAVFVKVDGTAIRVCNIPFE